MHRLFRLGALLVLLGVLALPYTTPSPIHAWSSSLASARFTQDGAPHYVEIPASASLNMGDQTSYTLEAWVQLSNSTGCQTVIGNGRAASYWLGVCDGKVTFSRTRSMASLVSTVTLRSRTWNHIAVVYNNGRQFMYVNGILNTTQKGIHTPITTLNTAVGIGADIDTNQPREPLSGAIDNVRIWKTNRSLDTIRASMYMTFDTPQPRLVAQWHFNQTWNDSVSTHHGINHGATFMAADPAGAATDVPALSFTSTCPSIPGATALAIGTDTYLAHTATDMYICLKYAGYPYPAASEATTIYLDSQFSRHVVAQSDDVALRLYGNGSMQALVGDGAGGYVPTTLPTGSWDAGILNIGSADFPSPALWFRISSNLVGGWNRLIGLAIDAIHVSSHEPFTWPVSAQPAKPKSWAPTYLKGSGSVKTFHGSVAYVAQFPNDTPKPLQGATVQVLGGFSPDQFIAVAETQSTVAGAFTLTSDDPYPYHRVRLKYLPGGYQAKSTAADPPYHVLDATTAALSQTLPTATQQVVFTVSDVQVSAFNDSSHPTLRIVAPKKVIANNALTDFVAFKRNRGLHVVIHALEDVVKSSGITTDTAIALHTWEVAAKKSDPTFKYLLLIGTHKTIPMPAYAVYAVNYASCLVPPDIRNDWYYADLSSDWDSNRDSCFAEGIYADSAKWQGTFKADAQPLFAVDVRVGRIPIDDPLIVEQVLKQSTSFEIRADSDKDTIVQAMSMNDIKGRCWDAKNKLYNAQCTVGTDGAYIGEAVRSAITSAFNTAAYSFRNYYENIAKDYGGIGPVTKDGVPSEAQVTAVINGQNPGLVALNGHGSEWNIIRTLWTDYNQNTIAEQPASPTDTLPMKPDNEVYAETLLSKSTAIQSGRTAVYILNACSTGLYKDPNSLAVHLLKHGTASAWIGGTSVTYYGLGWNNTSDWYNQAITRDLEIAMLKNISIGDAFWQVMQKAAQRGDVNAFIFALYGDPTMYYWGNSSALSINAPWPMLRQDPQGHGVSSLWGPEAPAKILDLAKSPVISTALINTSPVIDSYGRVYVTNDKTIDVINQGGWTTSITLDAAVLGTPILASNGAVYAMDVDNFLYIFEPNIPIEVGASAFHRTTKHSLPWPQPSNLVLAPNGMIGVALYRPESNQTVLQIIRPDGFLFNERVIANTGAAIGLSAGMDDRYYLTSANQLTRIPQDGNQLLGAYKSPVQLTTAPLLYNGLVYIGRIDGTVVAIDATSMAVKATFKTDGLITSGPISGAGYGGHVLVGTANGTLYDLSTSLNLNWSAQLGASINGQMAFAANNLYVVSGNYLYGYSQGKQTSKTGVGATGGGGSVVVGFNRQLAVQTKSGRLLVYGETPMPAVTEFKAVNISGRLPSIALSWKSPVSVRPAQPSVPHDDYDNSFLLQRKTATTDWEDWEGFSITTTSYVDTDIAPDTDYAYRIKLLWNDDTETDYVTLPNLVRSTPALPNEPSITNIQATDSGHVAIQWSYAGPSIQGYRVERSSDSGQTYMTVGDVITGTTTFVDRDLTPSTAYMYRIQAYSEVGDRSSPSQSVVTWDRTLAAPDMVAATLVSDDAVQITWNPGPIDAQAVVEVQPLGYAGYMSIGTVAANQSLIHHPQQPHNYRYRVKFVRGTTESPYSTPTLGVNTQGFTGIIHTVHVPLVMR